MMTKTSEVKSMKGMAKRIVKEIVEKLVEKLEYLLERYCKVAYEKQEPKKSAPLEP